MGSRDWKDEFCKKGLVPRDRLKQAVTPVRIGRLKRSAGRSCRLRPTENVSTLERQISGMGFRLLLYDKGGAEIGWIEAARTDPVPDVQWRSPWEYEWKITHPEPEQWDGVEAALQSSADPHERGKTGEVIETEKLTFTPDRMHRTDTDGPEAYLRDIARFAEWHGAASTEIVET